MKYLVTVVFAFAAMSAAAHAAPMTIGGVNFDTDNSATDVLWARGGVFAGLPANLREACADPTDSTSTVGPTGEVCRADEAAGFNLANEVELTSSGTLANDDVLSVFFANPVVNFAGSCLASPDGGIAGPASAADYAGCDLIVFEVGDQADNPNLSLTLGGLTVFAVLLADIEFDRGDGGDTDDPVHIWGFDLTGLGVAIGGSASNPLFLGGDVGSPDIAAIIGINVIPIPAAAPLFLAGIAGLGFAARRRRKIT